MRPAIARIRAGLARFARLAMCAALAGMARCALVLGFEDTTARTGGDGGNDGGGPGNEGGLFAAAVQADGRILTAGHRTNAGAVIYRLWQ